MSRLEELINELCPDGVEYRTIGETCTISDGFPFSAKDFKEIGTYPVTRITDISNGRILVSDKKVSNLPNKIKKEQILSNGEILVALSGSTGKVGYNDNKTLLVNQRIAIIRNKDILSNGFLKHCLINNNFTEYCFSHGTGPQNNLSKKDLLNYKIPIPPLEIQSEIVHILDSFTLLTAELTAELTARQKQYAFYRDYLLDFSDEDVTKKIPDIDCSNVEYKRLGDIATAIYRGAGIKRDEVTETGIPCVRYGEIYTTYNVTFNNCVSHTDEDKIQNKKYFEHGDVLFAITGESVEEIAKSCVYLGHDKCLAGGDIVVLKHNQNPKYMAYVLSTTNAQSQKSKGKVKSKVVHSSVPAISDIIIPIPPLAEQEKIANMIERFDHLCNDISNGLPAEIEARKKQYEYYRDTLLSFDDKACSHIVKVERERANTQ